MRYNEAAVLTCDEGYQMDLYKEENLFQNVFI